MGNATTKTAAKRTKKSFQPPVVVESAPAAPALIAIKGFDTNLVCNPIGVPFQFEIGKTYTHAGSVRACKSGFHAVEYPLDVFSYYAPADSRYAEVVLSGELSRHGNDTKVAAASITISAELRVPDLIQRAIKWVIDRCTPANAQHATGYQSASSATGDQSASSATGYRSASSATGDRSASSATGDQSASSATGYRSASSATGDRSASSATGYRSASSATGYQSASSATGYQSASSATGYQSASSATGDRSASSATGDRSASLNTGNDGSSEVLDGERQSFGVAIASGFNSKARAAAGSALVVVFRNDDGSLRHIKAVIAGTDDVKPDTWYALSVDGELIEAQ